MKEQQMRLNKELEELDELAEENEKKEGNKQ